MAKTSYHKLLAAEIRATKACGVIVNTLKFCDFVPFDHLALKEQLSELPFLLLEHDYTMDSEGQAMTRIEAFFESLGLKKKGGGAPSVKSSRENKFFIGIDSGSHATKLVCINSSGDLLARELVETGSSVDSSCNRLMEMLYAKVPSARQNAKVIATGYGRKRIDFADMESTEISCHALGAFKLIGRPATLIDIGGQDSKAILIGKDGRVEKFAMNDKCAAGTGRFLEVMATKLGMTLTEFALIASEASSEATISSMCSVFAESEVISLIASGATKAQIAKGIHTAIAKRTAALARRIGGKPPYFMAGGVAKNPALVAALSDALNEKIEAIPDPQFSGALGAALSGMP